MSKINTSTELEPAISDGTPADPSVSFVIVTPCWVNGTLRTWADLQGGNDKPDPGDNLAVSGRGSAVIKVVAKEICIGAIMLKDDTDITLPTEQPKFSLFQVGFTLNLGSIDTESDPALCQFQIGTNGGTITTMGTSLHVQRTGDTTTIKVMQGSIKIVPDKGQESETYGANRHVAFSVSSSGDPQYVELPWS
ncbi:MAG: hypothetical protein K1X67_08630 [Fimbriimonadaceae bacterium]|nr:hypothetical protein [Fimbriimonadaceae bacterium]